MFVAEMFEMKTRKCLLYIIGRLETLKENENCAIFTRIAMIGYVKARVSTLICLVLLQNEKPK